MDVGSVDSGESYKVLLDDETFEKQGKDWRGRIVADWSCDDGLKSRIKPLMSRPDRIDAKVEGSYDRDRGGRVEGSITWTWETKEEKETTSQENGDPENSKQDVNSTDKN